MVHVNQSLSCIRRCRTDLVSIVFPVSFARFLRHFLYFKLSFLEGFRSAFINSVFSFFCCNCSSESRSKSRIQTVRECSLHPFKDLLVDVMCSRVDREWQRRRRFHSEDALDSLRLKNSRAGYLSRITKLYRETEELLNDSKNVNEVSEKLLDIDEAFARFEKAHYDYIATLSGNLEEWESEARYFKEHCNRKMNFESRIEQWIHSVKVPVVTHEDIDTQPEDVVSTAHLSIRQLKAKQALAHLKLKQLTQKQELLRQEEETKLKLEVLEAQYEVQKTDLQVKLFQDEDIDYPNFPEVFKELNPFDKGVEGRTTSGYKQEDPESRGVQKSIESKGSQTQLNPNALE